MPSRHPPYPRPQTLPQKLTRERPSRTFLLGPPSCLGGTGIRHSVREGIVVVQSPLAGSEDAGLRWFSSFSLFLPFYGRRGGVILNEHPVAAWIRGMLVPEALLAFG